MLYNYIQCWFYLCRTFQIQSKDIFLVKICKISYQLLTKMNCSIPRICFIIRILFSWNWNKICAWVTAISIESIVSHQGRYLCNTLFVLRVYLDISTPFIIFVIPINLMLTIGGLFL